MEVLLSFGTLMFRAGNTAFRTREWMEVMARKLGADAISVTFSLDSLTASIRRNNEWITRTREIGPPGVNAWRIGELEKLAKTKQQGVEAGTIAAELAEIGTTPPRNTDLQVAAAVGVACGAFAFLNGCCMPEITAAGVGGVVGQWSRSRLLRRQLNQHGVAAFVRSCRFGRLCTDCCAVEPHWLGICATSRRFHLLCAVPCARISFGRRTT